MYFYNVDGINAQLNDLRNLPADEFTREVTMIENDLKGYALSKFKFDEYQNSTIERIEPGQWLYFGAKLSEALRNGDVIEVTEGESKAKCPKITITIELNF